ncbi:glutelin type-B 2-like [Salvia divinorum]|uniref:Glutelin type-B 2-like n=1 Tax=Salvia divinorum TaxID=28513 RepID=A0ABD1IH86_SALDI
MALLRSFSTEFISKMYDLNDDQSKKLLQKQSNTLVIKIDKGIQMPQISNCKKEEYVINLDAVKVDEGSPLVDGVGLSPKLVRLEPENVLDAYYSTAHQVVYVVKGGGRVQIVGLNGTRMVDEVVEEGQLIVVPKFFVVAMIASHQGLELFCVSTSPRPISKPIAGKASAYKSLSSSVLENALNVNAELVESFKTQI